MGVSTAARRERILREEPQEQDRGVERDGSRVMLSKRVFWSCVCLCD